MQRTFGLSRDVGAVNQLQKPAPAVTVPVQPLPPGSAGRVTAQQLGITDSDPITFYVIGDHGGVRAPAPQNAVSYAMQRRAGPSPAFVYSVGDWVYFGGDEAGWETQVYEAYGHLSAPLVGIPGNHDDQYGGDPPYDPARGPLDGWMANMCTPQPEVPPADPQLEYGRHTQTEPWCDWTLELRAVTIIGLYSNVPSGGHLDQSQIDWLTAELKAAPTERPLIVTLHHPPYSVDMHHGGSQTMGTALDSAFNGSGRWPELVLAGHVHDFQSFTRKAPGKVVRYVVVGNSGYHNLHQLAHDASSGMDLGGGVTLEYGDASEYGFLVLTAGGGAISGEYVGVKPGTMPDGSNAQVTPGKYKF
jgi:calcineurin-like phosphoesterase family protein